MTSSDSANYPKKRKAEASEYPKPSTITTTSSRSNRDFKRDFRAFVKLIIFIELVAVFGLISTLYVTAVRKIMQQEISFTFERTPGVGYFDEFAVSSSSELCSEFARTMYMEGYRLNLIAVTLQYCLHMQQPDRSGELGHSVALHYSSNGCRYTRGEVRAPLNGTLIERLVNESQTDFYAQSRGQYSELFPLDLVTTLGLLENTTHEELEDVALLTKSEHGDKCIALTISSVDTLELGPLISQRLLFSASEELSARDRGEVVSFPDFDERMKHFVSLPKFRNTTKLEAYIKLKIESEHNAYVPPFTSDSSQLTDIGNNYWKDGRMISDNRGQHYCFPGDTSLSPGNTSLSSIVFSTISGKDHQVHYDNEDTTYILEKLMRDLSETLRNLQLPPAWKKLLKFKNLVYEKQRKLAYNQFVLANHNETYTYTGSIGSQFGSLYFVPFMNNLMIRVVENLRREKGLTNGLLTFIAVKNNSMSIAYTGNPGFTSTSIGVPRMLNAILRQSHYNEKLEEAVTAPLLYLDPNYPNTMHKYNYPHRSNLTRSYSMKNKILDAPSETADSIAALSRRCEEGRLVLVPFYKNKATTDKWQFNTRAIGV